MPITIEQFVERLTQSGLMSAQEIDAIQQQLHPDKRPNDVQQLAQALGQEPKQRPKERTGAWARA